MAGGSFSPYNKRGPNGTSVDWPCRWRAINVLAASDSLSVMTCFSTASSANTPAPAKAAHTTIASTT